MMKNTALALLITLVGNLFAPALAHAAPEPQALSLLGVEQAAAIVPVAQPSAPALSAPAAPAADSTKAAKGLWERAGNWLKEFGAGLVDGVIHAVPNLVQGLKENPLQTTLMVGGMIALGAVSPVAALAAGGGMLAYSAYETGGDPRKLGALTGENVLFAAVGALGARGLKRLKGKPAVEAPAVVEPPAGPKAPIEEPPVASIVEAPKPPVEELAAAPKPPRKPKQPKQPEHLKPRKTNEPRPVPDADVLAHDAATLAGKGTSSHWVNPKQPSEISTGAPGSNKYVADSNVFMDLEHQGSARSRMDAVISNEANQLTVPEAIQKEFLGPKDVHKTQEKLWGQTGAQRRPVANPAGVEELRHARGSDNRPMLEGAFGFEDMVLMETALQTGAPVVTRNFAMIEQIRGANAPLVRANRYKNVKIEYIGN